MANIKFSQFTQENDAANVDFVVGYVAASNTNVRIAPSQLGTGVYLPLTGGTMTGDILLDTSVSLALGASSNFNMFHNGTDVTLQNFTGDFVIVNKANDKDIIFQSDDGSGGVTTYFKVDALSQAVTFVKPAYFTDNVKALFGNSSDLQIYHDGSNSYIKDTSGTGDLRIDTNTFRLRSANGGETMIRAFEDGAVILSHNNLDKLTTTSSGISVTGGWVTSSVSVAQANVEFTDNSKALFGNGNDFQIYHDGSNSYIKNTGGDLYIQNAGKNSIVLKSDAAVDLYYNGVKKFETTNTGIAIPSGQSVDFINSNLGYNAIKRNSTLGGLEIRTGNVASINILDNSNVTFAGNIGIGAAPQAWPLDVKGADTDNSVLARFFSNTGTRGSFIIRNGSGVDPTTFIGTSGGSEELSIGTENSEVIRLDASQNATFAGDVLVENNLYLTDAGTVRGKIQLNASDKDDLDIKAVSLGSNMKFFTVDTERMRIDSAGNVGIGTGIPIDPLNVQSTGASDYAFRIFRSTSATQGLAGFYEGSANQGQLYLLKGDNTVGVFLNSNGDSYLNGGNVGIGTTSPVVPLDVEGKIRSNDSSSGDYLEIFCDGSVSGDSYIENTSNNIQIKSADATSFSTSGSVAMFINSSQNVGIGTTTPDHKLEVQGVISSADAGLQKSTFANVGNDLVLTANADATNATANILFKSSGTGGGAVSEKMRINGSGYIYVGTDGVEPSASQVGVRITGTQGQSFWNSANSGTSGYNHFNFYNGNGTVGAIITSGSATAFNTSSDYRLKEDLKDFDGLDKVSKIPVYDFKWKVDDSRSYGVLAHELQKVLPDAVSGEKDAEEMQGVDYSKIVPLLIKSIQELKAEVELLKNK